MGVDFFGPVMPRQPVKNSADRANAIIQATNAARQMRGVPSGTGLRTGVNLHATVITVSNDTEDPIRSGDPVLIRESAIVTPASNRADWRKCDMVDGGLVLDEGIVGVWGISLQLIDPGFAGLVLLSGVTAAKVTKRPGEDLMVDMPCFRGDETEGDERKLYTSAAGCAIILDMPEVDDGIEFDAIVHVLGYRTAEPSTWALLDGWIHADDSGDPEAKVVASLKRRGLEGGWDNVPGRFGTSRDVEARCFKLPSGSRLQGYVELCPDPWRGIWYVRDSLNCPEAIP